MPEQLEFPWERPAQAEEKSAPRAANAPIAPKHNATPPAPPPADSPPSGAHNAAARVHAALTHHIGGPVFLRITNNSSSIISTRRREDGVLQVHLHHMFLQASDIVVAALAKWISKGRSVQAGEVIDAFIREHSGLIRPRRRRVIRCVTRGRCHDLRELFDEVNAAHFGAAVTAHISWGKMPAKIQRRSIRFGTYSSREGLIRIHPLLDQEFVPRYLVRYIVYHEMLHAHMGIAESPSGRRSMHSPQFKRAEKAYPDFVRATAWIGNPEHMRRLLRTRK